MSPEEYAAVRRLWVAEKKADIVGYLRDFADELDEGLPGGHTELLNHVAGLVAEQDRYRDALQNWHEGDDSVLHGEHPDWCNPETEPPCICGLDLMEGATP